MKVHLDFGRWAAPAVLAIAVRGCGGSTGATRACDPLETVTLPVALGQVLGVGRDAQGTVYLIDQTVTGTDRLFVSQGAILARQPLGGSGSVTDAAGTLFVVTTRAAASPLAVEIHTDAAGHPTAMGVFNGTLATKTFEIGAMGDVLQLLTTDALSGYTLQNLPGTVSIQHLATLADGRALMVMIPDVDASGNDVRVFFGTPPSLVERSVTPTAQPRSYNQLTFDIDGRQAVATFSSALAPSIASMLAVGADVFPLTEAPAGTPAPAGTTFRCF